MKILKGTFKVIEYILLVVLIALLIFSGVIIVKKYALGEDVPKVFGYSNSIVVSGSMESALSIDDWVFVKEQDTYEVGDIITYTSGNDLVTHRIIEITEDGYYTKGDANNTKDPNVIAQTQVEGKVVYIIPNVGRVVEWIKSPYGIVTLILVVAVLMIIPYIVRRIKNEK